MQLSMVSQLNLVFMHHLAQSIRYCLSVVKKKFQHQQVELTKLAYLKYYLVNEITYYMTMLVYHLQLKFIFK